MNIRIITQSKIFWGLSAKALNVLGGLILLPIVVHYFNKELLALFFLFVSLTTITGILDFGFNATLTRNFAYAYAGAHKIHAEGVCSEFGKSTNWKLIGELYILAKKIYFYLSLVALFTFFIPGSIYIYTVVRKSSISPEYAIVCWLVYSAASVLAMYFFYLSTIIQGRGDVNLANQITVVSRFVNILISSTLIVYGCGLFSISISAISVCVIERILYYKFVFIDDNHKKLKLIKNTKREKIKANLKIISANSLKFGVVSLGAYLITRATIIIATSYLGLLDSASYIFTIQIITIITGIAFTIIGVYLPKMSQLVKEPDKQLRLFCFGNIFSLCLYLFCAVILLFCGQYLLLFVGSKTPLLSVWQMVVLLIIYLLEVQHSNFAVMITTDNQVPFVGAAIYSGIAIVISSIFLLRFTNLGVWGLIISQGVVQLAYNNWYWICYVCKKYNVSYVRMISLGVEYVKNK